MTDEPPDPVHRQAAAAYQSAGKLRKPSPAPQTVRLVEHAAQPSQKQPSNNEPDRLAEAAAGAAPSNSASASAEVSTSPPKGVSLMITGAQKDGLRRLGVSEVEIRHMTPAEAHRRLGLTGR